MLERRSAERPADKTARTCSIRVEDSVKGPLAALPTRRAQHAEWLGRGAEEDTMASVEETNEAKVDGVRKAAKWCLPLLTARASNLQPRKA